MRGEKAPHPGLAQGGGRTVPSCGPQHSARPGAAPQVTPAWVGAVDCTIVHVHQHIAEARQERPGPRAGRAGRPGAPAAVRPRRFTSPRTATAWPLASVLTPGEQATHRKAPFSAWKCLQRQLFDLLSPPCSPRPGHGTPAGRGSGIHLCWARPAPHHRGQPGTCQRGRGGWSLVRVRRPVQGRHPQEL